MINDRQPQDTEAKILQAAECEFLTKGFAGARTTSIAQAAGVTHAMFHYYFRTKDKLFERIISEKIALMKELLLDTVANSGMSLEEKIRNVIERHLDFVAANPNLPRFLVGEVFAYPERAKVLTEKIKQFAPRMIAELQRQIDEAAANGIFRKVDARMLIIDIVSLNIFSYMASPLINAVLDNCMEDSERFLAQRKKENFDTIMRKLKP
ncbi:MAG: TetR/AcrR family transcriptional regulator [Muribaculaceae bacterium]|nr:TetR/AcrR family transcriptional regulator [Muribaculaceae bacterium]